MIRVMIGKNLSPWARCLSLLSAAGLLLIFSLGIPVYFQVLDSAVLTKGGRDAISVESLASDFLAEDKVGPTRLLWATDNNLPADSADADHLAELLKDHPSYAVTGGPSPSLQSRLSQLDWQPEGADATAVMTLLLPREHQDKIKKFLQPSPHTEANPLLGAEGLTTLSYFQPASSTAGRPWQAVVLLAAWLDEENHFPAETSITLQNLTAQALRGDVVAARLLETAYVGLSSWGKRLNWLQLVELVKRLENVRAIGDSGSIVRSYPERWAELYTAILLSDNVSALVNYIQTHQDRAWESLDMAMPLGRSAVTTLLKTQKVLHSPSPTLQALAQPFSWTHQSALLDFAIRSPQLALLIKVTAWCLSIFALFLALSVYFPKSGGRWPPMALTGSLSVLFALVLWSLIEPGLFQQNIEPLDETPLFFFDLVNRLGFNQDIIQSDVTMFDQVTIITLLVFFLMQLVVYLLCLVKVTQIKKQTLSAPLKLQLLANDETLFDLGLYVGLAGTVFSLILLALGVKEASLIAAYASTLFGILFVALLRILHLRPFRRQLIIEADGPSSHE